MGNNNEKTVSKKKRLMIVFDEATRSITILDKKGREVVQEVRASKVEIDFAKNTLNLTKVDEVEVIDLEKGSLFSYTYDGNSINVVGDEAEDSAER